MSWLGVMVVVDMVFDASPLRSLATSCASVLALVSTRASTIMCASGAQLFKDWHKR